MRTPARPRLPDGDCVFISGARIVARADAPFIAAGVVRSGTVVRCVLLEYGALSVSKFKNNSSFETEKERMWVMTSASTQCSRGGLCRFYPSGMRP
jgi:hypothetical protein